VEHQEDKSKELLKEIGERIRHIRSQRKMSLKDLAQKIGFTKSYLSQIENLKREPPISTLSKIAYVLDVDFSFLVNGELHTWEEDVTSLAIVRSGERKASFGPSGEMGYFYESLSYKKQDRLMDGYVITIGPDYPEKPYQHEGQELVYVLEGTQEFFYDGKTYVIEKGDCYFFDSNKPHYSRTLGDSPGKILMVFTIQKAGNPGVSLYVK